MQSNASAEHRLHVTSGAELLGGETITQLINTARGWACKHLEAIFSFGFSSDVVSEFPAA